MKNLLVIDDSALIRLKVKNTLEPEGYKVVEATSFKQIKRDNFARDIDLKEMDIILLDIHLKQESGLEILPYLVRNYPRIPVIMISVEAKKEIILRSLELGASDYILKPFDKRILMNRIDSLISEQATEVLSGKKERFTSNLNVFKTNLSLEINRALRSGLAFSATKIKLKQDITPDNHNKIKEFLTEEIRDIDQIYNISKNEYILLLPLTDAGGVEVLLNRLKGGAAKMVDDLEKDININTATFPEQDLNEDKYNKKRHYRDILLKKLEVY